MVVCNQKILLYASYMYKRKFVNVGLLVSLRGNHNAGHWTLSTMDFLRTTKILNVQKSGKKLKRNGSDEITLVKRTSFRIINVWISECVMHQNKNKYKLF